MPYRSRAFSLAAGATANLCENWQYEYPPKESLFELMVRADAAGVQLNVTTGAESIVQAGSVVDAGGAQDELPSPENCEKIVDVVQAGERLVANVTNTTAGAIDIVAIMMLTYR